MSLLNFRLKIDGDVMLKNISLKLLVGEPIDIIVGKVHALKIKDIIEMGEKKYNQYLSILLYDVDLVDINKDVLKELQIDKFTTYHFLLLQSHSDDEFKNFVIEALECFFKENVYYDEEMLVFYLVDTNNDIKYITPEIYELFKKVLIKQNFLKELEEEEELIFGNELARQWYLDLKKKEKTRPKPKNNIDMQSIISGVYWKSGKSKEEILNLSIYELYEGYYRLCVIDNCNNLAQGIYHGNVDGKKMKESDLNWAKIIKFDNGNLN